MAHHHRTVTSHKSSSVHMRANSINSRAVRATGVWDKNMFSRMHLPAQLTHSLILHSSLFSKYMVHEPHMHKDPHTRWKCAKIFGTPSRYWVWTRLQPVSSASSTSTLCHGWGRFVVADEINKGSHDSSGMSTVWKEQVFPFSTQNEQSLTYTQGSRHMSTHSQANNQKKTTWDTLTFASTQVFAHTIIWMGKEQQFSCQNTMLSSTTTNAAAEERRSSAATLT